MTPWHLGPGLAAKSVLGRRMSLVAFMAAQVLMDGEVVLHIYTGARPLHAFMHTYIGATVAAVLTIVLGWPGWV